MEIIFHLKQTDWSEGELSRRDVSGLGPCDNDTMSHSFSAPFQNASLPHLRLGGDRRHGSPLVLPASFRLSPKHLSAFSMSDD